MVNGWRLIVCPERREKQGMVMNALKRSVGGVISYGDAPVNEPFICAGQLWAVERMVPQAMKLGTPFWVIDNGYYLQSGKGRHHTGHWEFTYKGLEPVLLKNPDYDRLPFDQHCTPWRYDPNGDVLIGIPGITFGRVVGMNMRRWIETIKYEVAAHTAKRIRLRDKWSKLSIDEELKGVSVLVTHSSHVAIDAIVRGIPAIVAPSSPAAPVCSHRLEDIDCPLMPDRDTMRHWWASLMCQQFTLEEMRAGLSINWMHTVMEQVDGDGK